MLTDKWRGWEPSDARGARERTANLARRWEARGPVPRAARSVRWPFAVAALLTAALLLAIVGAALVAAATR